MNKLQTLTDFFIWLTFVVTLVATIALSAAGTYYLVVNPSWQPLPLFVGAIFTLGLHYAIRLTPTGGGSNH